MFGVFLLFEFTIGSKIKYYERNLKSLISKSNIELIKVQIREEMKLAINKDRYLNEEDSKLIGQFLMKIEKEINVDESN